MYHLGQYIPRNSLIHSLDPRVKIISTMVLSLVILGGELHTTSIVCGFILLVMSLSGITMIRMFQALRPVVFFLLLLFLLHSLFTDGTPIPPFPSWPVTLTYEGVYLGAITTWQFMLLLMAGSILMMTTSPSELVPGFERLLRPLKIFRIPSHDVALMISIALRFVPTLLEELEGIKEAQMARGACFSCGPLLQRIKAHMLLLMPLIVNTIRRAEELVAAMESRGYHKGSRTPWAELNLSWADFIALGIIGSVSVVHILLN